MLTYRKYFYILSFTFVAASIVSLAFFGLRFGIDFTGGSMMEVTFEGERPSHQDVRTAISGVRTSEGEQLTGLVIQDIGTDGLILRFQDVGTTTHQGILERLQNFGSIQEQRFESVGPAIGQETKQKSLWAMGLVLVMILVYIAWAFRRISFPLSSWKYGVIAVVALFHDILITVGVFSMLGYVSQVEVGVPFVAALITILGYSINDTIVLFDRIRENVVRQGSAFNFEEIINASVRQTYMRSLGTSLTTLFVLIALFFFGGETITNFVLALIIGITAGTYSSIFLAAPLLFSWSMIKLRHR